MWRSIPVLFCVLGLCAARAFAQGGETDPKVQELYAQAKEAQGRGDLAGAIAGYREILKIAPRLGPAYNNLGSLYFRQRDYRSAAEVLEKGLQVHPGMPSALALLAISLYQMGEYKEARPRLEAAVKAIPNDVDLPLYLAKDLTKLGDLQAAEARLRELGAKQPGNQEVWYSLAKLHMQMSEQDFARMKAIDADSVLSHQLSGEVMESMNNYEGAVVELKKAVDMAPQKAGSHYKLGDALLALSRWDGAAEQFQAELTIDPGNCLARWKLGRAVLESNGDAQTALGHLDDALKGCPGLTDALPDRARALVKLNRTADAVADLQRAVKANPDEPANHFLLGKAYRTLGRTQESQAEMQIFSKLDEKQRAAVAEQAQEVIRNKTGAQ